MMHDRVASNGLLQSLDAGALTALNGVPVELEAGAVIQQSGVQEQYAYFPFTAVVSLVSTMASGQSVEIALVGREGMAGLSGVLASSEGSTDNVVQVGGICLRATTAAVRALRNSNPGFRAAFDRYTTSRLIHVARIAACNRLHPIGNRLSRWLLGIHDRADGNAFRLPQQTIADMLGVQRPTITVELQKLHESGAIRYRGRLVVITDRHRLESLACECHDALHREYVNLLRPLQQRDRGQAAATQPAAERNADADLEALRDIAGRLLVVSIREQEARERAEAAGRAKDDFLATVSHELRAPLQAILGWCAIAKVTDSGGNALAAIERNARAQLTLVDDLLDSARMTADTLRIAPAVVDPKSVLEAAIETVRPAAEAKGVTVRLNVCDELSPLVADGERLRQVLVNILMNSVKFTDAGGSVDTDVSSTGRSVDVQVRDTGRGIASQVLPHVFERFRQGDDRDGERRGLGLGLSIARALVELHGGTIEMTSPGEGHGATCSISLPRSAAAIADSDDASEPT
jgi:signal transduction histidine kinase